MAITNNILINEGAEMKKTADFEEETVKGPTPVVTVNLRVETANGYKNGEAYCYYREEGGNWIEFYETGFFPRLLKIQHNRQPFPLAAQNALSSLKSNGEIPSNRHRS